MPDPQFSTPPPTMPPSFFGPPPKLTPPPAPPPDAAPPGAPATGDTPASWEDIISGVAKKYQIDPRLAVAIAQTESSMKPGAVSDKGATGLMQLMPATAARWKVNINDPLDNIRGGMQEMRSLLDQHNGDVTMALRRYYASPNAPDSVSDPYVQKVLGRLKPTAATPATRPAAAAPSTSGDWAKPENIAAAAAAGPNAGPPEPWWARAIEGTRSGVSDAILGAAKGAGQTATNLGELVHRIPGVTGAVDDLYGTPGLSHAAFTEANADLAPEGVMQHIGKIGEQLAEWFVGGPKISQAATSLADTVGPKIAPYVGKTLSTMLPRAVVEGAGSGAMAAAQGGDPKTAAVLGAVGVPAAGALSGALERGLESSAVKSMTQALAPTGQRYKAIAERIVPQVLKEGIWGSRASIVDQAAERLSSVGQEIDDALQQNSGDAFRVRPVRFALEKLKAPFRVLGKNGSWVNFEPRPIEQIDKLIGVLDDLGKWTTVDKIVAVRQAWDKVVAQAGGFAQRAKGAIGMPLADASEVAMKREASGAIRKILGDAYPDLDKLNKEWSFYKNLRDVTEATVRRTMPHAEGIGAQLAETGGNVAGSLAASGANLTKKVGQGFIAGKVFKLVREIVQSPTWRSGSAVLKHNLADALAAGDLQSVARVAASLGIVSASKIGDEEPLASPPPPPPSSDINLTLKSDRPAGPPPRPPR